MSSNELRFLQEWKGVVRGKSENKHTRAVYTGPGKMLMLLSAKSEKGKDIHKFTAMVANVTLSSDKLTAKLRMVLDHKRISYDIEQCQESDSSQLLFGFGLP